MFCVKCRKATNTTDLRDAVSKNGRNMKRGKCVVCGTTKTQFRKRSSSTRWFYIEQGYQ